ncbi:hypothetical protein GGS26DRAFT_493247 [Hypomontagnella submonticulosa]|nr:hypothetical protein GGS26DRAFT_493247 [Hypomontagnella submonticulosa]
MPLQGTTDKVKAGQIMDNDRTTSQHQGPQKESSEGGQPSSNSSESDSQGQQGQPEVVHNRPRDRVTGRELAEDGGSCLRCIEKGLRCTLNFKGVRGEDKCAACRRSNAEHCIRQLAPEQRIHFTGPPWHNPNFFTVGTALSPMEMEEILYDHYLGKKTAMFGTYEYEAVRKQMALPPFNGSDLPLEERPKNWQSMDWKDALPIWQNRSLLPRPIKLDDDDDDDERREPYLSEEALRYLRIKRKYIPRPMHLKEALKLEEKQRKADLGETY